MFIFAFGESLVSCTAMIHRFTSLISANSSSFFPVVHYNSTVSFLHYCSLLCFLAYSSLHPFICAFSLCSVRDLDSLPRAILFFLSFSLLLDGFLLSLLLLNKRFFSFHRSLLPLFHFFLCGCPPVFF